MIIEKRCFLEIMDEENQKAEHQGKENEEERKTIKAGNHKERKRALKLDWRKKKKDY